MSQQGNVRYTNEAKAIKPVADIIDEDQDFEFDVEVSNMEQYLNYRDKILAHFTAKMIETENTQLSEKE